MAHRNERDLVAAILRDIWPCPDTPLVVVVAVARAVGGGHSSQQLVSPFLLKGVFSHYLMHL